MRERKKMASVPNHCFPVHKLTQFRRQLLHWFRNQGRSLPWRETRDPYRIWISEIMLQQTTVKAVIPYFERFLARFPTIQDLAVASEAEVLQYWEGLGYYSRGRNLRKAAIVLYETSNGEFPSDLDALQALPGIGRYTAGAIRSFAFDLPAPIVEANTLRLYCRLLNNNDDPRSPSGGQQLWSFAEKLQSPTNAGQFNQALMELGALICTPVTPDCGACPVKRYCRACIEGNQENVPVKKKRPQITNTVEVSVAVRWREQFLVRQRQPEELWAGMWDFIRFPVKSVSYEEKLTPRLHSQLAFEASSILTEMTKLQASELTYIREMRHSVTRYRIRLICLMSRQTEAQHHAWSLPDHCRWVSLQELSDLPMPITGRRLANLLKDQL